MVPVDRSVYATNHQQNFLLYSLILVNGLVAYTRLVSKATSDMHGQFTRIFIQPALIYLVNFEVTKPNILWTTHINR